MIKKPAFNWSNYDNQDFYEILPIDTFKGIADRGGLTDCPDLEAIEKYIKISTVILEIGAGYGRVIDYLSRNYPDKSIIGIESCEKLAKFLENKYRQNQQITIIRQDIHGLNIKAFPDLIVWMWSGIADFTPAEQISILKNLKAIMPDHGAIVVDTIPANITPIGMEKQDDPQVFVQKFQGVPIHTYSLTNEEIDHYAQELGLNVKHYDYPTTTGKRRLLHIFTK